MPYGKVPRTKYVEGTNPCKIIAALVFGILRQKIILSWCQKINNL